MITGRVVRLGASIRAAVELTIFGDNGTLIRPFATIDTGFTDELTLPQDVISALGLRNIGLVEVELGGGEIRVFNTYEATIAWQGQYRAVRVYESNGLPLIGMGLLTGNDLHIRAIHGGDVRIDPVS